MRYALIGDSQGQGVFPHLRRLLEAAGHTVSLSLAVPGKPPSWWAKSAMLPGQIASARPDVVVFLLAGNNTDFDPASYGRSAATLVGWARSAGAQTVYWLSPAAAVREPFATNHNRTAALEPTVLAPLGVRWMDMRPLTSSGHRDDGVHFTSAAYQAWASRLAPMLTQPTGLLPSLLPQPSATGTSTPAWVWWTLPAGVAALSLLLVRIVRRRREG